MHAQQSNRIPYYVSASRSKGTHDSLTVGMTVVCYSDAGSDTSVQSHAQRPQNSLGSQLMSTSIPLLDNSDMMLA